MSTHLVLVANSRDGSISTFEYAGGDLTPLATSDVGQAGLPFAVDADRGLVHAGVKDPNGVVTLKLDRASGRLERLGRIDAEGAPTYLALSPDGRLLLSASYHQGVGEVWQIGDDGLPTPAGEPIHRPNLHSVAVSADGQFAYFVTLRDDAVLQYRLAPTGELIPLDPPQVDAPAGSGPRHIILDADETSVYVNTEYSGEALHFRRDPDSGLLWFAGATPCVPADRGLGHSRFGADPREEHLIWGADLHLDAAGRVLFCSERNEGTISALPVAEDGSLGTAVAHSAVVPQPRSFAVLPDGALLVASEITPEVGVYDVDANGTLGLRVTHPVGEGANWVEILTR
ncbi:beta-propeller fold lactonase family protein [Brooklawnia cerclae]|uniref:6-phosphogluconolactonase n=1 Tax=Brooklawnia cerclae TaxID=349934 RepID=A0ABX0SIQ7_9ACTN|nr:beta-propeller fold lactonase family protein [Brooklawnia cerclae]NIH57794.1 6-phosphogluconolactonase [Brooklawnia cerclae]